MRDDRQENLESTDSEQGRASVLGLCHTCFAMAVQEGTCAKCGAPQKEANRNRRALPIGTLIANKYLIGKVLGSGSFGITYLAQDTALARRVALKEYFPNGLALRQADRVQVAFQHEQDEPAFSLGLTKFFQEGQTLAKFAHTGIVRVYDVLQANGSAYMAMEYVLGQSLKQYVQQRGGQLTQADATKIMSHVQEAVSAVHSANVVHRDIKPDNIYITPENRVLLLDFGGAQQLQTEQEHGQTAMFAYGYAAPEQYSQGSEKIGPWTDVYAYSATFYKLLTGKTLASAWEREADAQPLDWSQTPEVSGPLRQLIEQGLVLQPESRLQSLAAFDALLHAPFANTAAVTGTAKSIEPQKAVAKAVAVSSSSPAIAVAPSAKSSSKRLLALPVLVFLLGAGAWWMWGMTDSKQVDAAQVLEKDTAKTQDADAAGAAGKISSKPSTATGEGATETKVPNVATTVPAADAASKPNDVADAQTEMPSKTNTAAVQAVKEKPKTGATNNVPNNRQNTARASKPAQGANQSAKVNRTAVAQPTTPKTSTVKGAREDMIADSY